MECVHDARLCALGEGPLWHPLREELLWFDIIGNRMLSRIGDDVKEWRFDEHVSAAGWVDRDTLLIASETRLLRFDLDSGLHKTVCALEADEPATRSNDGRADPMGGFWIGTMGKAAQKGAGAIYRYFQGELRLIYKDISIPNAISFGPRGDRAYFADSAQRKVWQVALDPQGWPRGDPSVFLDLGGGDPQPDGAVVDASGAIWLAEWGGGCVSVWDSQGNLLHRVAVPAPQASCPAFGGAGLGTLFVTSARVGMTDAALAEYPRAGQTFAVPVDARGQREHRVILP